MRRLVVSIYALAMEIGLDADALQLLAASDALELADDAGPGSLFG